MELLNKIAELEKELSKIQLSGADQAESFRLQWLSKKGTIPGLYQELKEVPSTQKKEAGQKINELRGQAEQIWEAARLQKPRQKAVLQDLSMPGIPGPVGGLHPLTRTRKRIVEIFGRMGFDVSYGPEIEDDWHNFTALNFAPDHPARDMQDTFFVDAKGANGEALALRTHTSSVQIRVMEQQKPPIRTLSPGRVYRNEAISARAHCLFHQVEGLCVDKDISFADLKQVLYSFVREFFGPDVQVRFRPSYFPFTEPSAEMDASCLICHGKGCAVCKHSGWVEILGCGMVHPQVLKNCGIDPELYSGYAFGMGIERLTMLQYGIDDLRLFFEHDMGFLEQFKGI